MTRRGVSYSLVVLTRFTYYTEFSRYILLDTFHTCSVVFTPFLLSHFPTFTLSYFHTFLLSHFPTFTLSYFHTLLLSHFPTFTLSYFHTFLLSHFVTFTLCYFHTFLLSHFPTFTLSYFHTLLLSHFVTFTLCYFSNVLHILPSSSTWTECVLGRFIPWWQSPLYLEWCKSWCPTTGSVCQQTPCIATCSFTAALRCCWTWSTF